MDGPLILPWTWLPFLGSTPAKRTGGNMCGKRSTWCWFKNWEKPLTMEKKHVCWFKTWKKQLTIDWYGASMETELQATTSGGPAFAGLPGGAGSASTCRRNGTLQKESLELGCLDPASSWGGGSCQKSATKRCITIMECNQTVLHMVIHGFGVAAWQCLALGAQATIAVVENSICKSAINVFKALGAQSERW